MKRTIISLLFLFSCISALGADELWTRAEGEYFNRMVWHGDAEWTDRTGQIREGEIYIGVYGATYGLPSPMVAMRLYPDRKTYLTVRDYMEPGSAEPPIIPVSLISVNGERKMESTVSDDKIYLSGPDSISFVEALSDGQDLTLVIGVRNVSFTIDVYASNFAGFFDSWLSSEDFLTIGEWNLDRDITGTGTYTSITEYTSEDDGRALYFELCGDPEDRNSVQTVKMQMYIEEGGLAYEESDIDKFIVTYGPLKEWEIKETLFGTCYIFPEVRDSLLESIGEGPIVTLKAVERGSGREYTVDFDSEEFSKYLDYPYGFDY